MEQEYDTIANYRGFVSTKSLFSFIKKLKGDKLLYFVSMDDGDNFMTIIPFFELLTNPVYFSDREVYNPSHQYYPGGDIKNYRVDNYNIYKIYYR